MLIPSRDGLTPEYARKLDIVIRDLRLRGFCVWEQWLDRWEIDGEEYAGDLLTCLLMWGEDHLHTREDWT